MLLRGLLFVCGLGVGVGVDPTGLKQAFLLLFNDGVVVPPEVLTPGDVVPPEVPTPGVPTGDGAVPPQTGAVGVLAVLVRLVVVCVVVAAACAGLPPSATK